MKSALKTYLERCRKTFRTHHSKLDKVVPFPGTTEPTEDNRGLFEAAIKEAEESKEFEAFTRAIEIGPLTADLERIFQERKKKKSEKKREVKSLDKGRQNTIHQAAKGFFRNTGTYVKLWQGSEADESELLTILKEYKQKENSKLIRLFVFDGFIPFSDSKRLNNISLPVGDFKKYTEKELDNLLMLPQSAWHRFVNPETIKQAAIWHILTVREETEYMGMSGIWIGETFISNIDWSEIGESTKKESDIGIIGPVFLCIGEDANLAVEILIRTNIFEYLPVQKKVRNDYLPWDSHDDEGEPKPRTFVEYLGEDGKKLREIYRIWQRINTLDADGLLKYPTESYTRSVMNLHASWESFMEVFVGFVTVIESLLTPDSRQELAYKMAVRGAALLTSDSKHRIHLFQILDEFYKTRSLIVHEGRTDKEEPYQLKDTISYNLTKISREIFLRYICILNLGLDGELPKWILPDPGKLSSRTSRPKTIANILDGLVLDPKLTDQLEKRMEELGVYEDWIGKRPFSFGTKR